MATNTRHFKFDAAAPLRRQTGESVKNHQHFLKWRELGCPSDDLLAGELRVKPSSVARWRKGFKWEQRHNLDVVRKAKPVAEQLYPTVEKQEPAKRRPGRPRKNADTTLVTASSDELLPPPEPIQMGLHEFASRYGRFICPGWEMDPLIDLMLTKLEEISEGKAGGRLLINPPPRSSKTTCCILALVHSLLRYPDRGQALISANGRLASLNNQLMRTLFEAACPPGYGIAKDTRSRLAWKPNWQGAREQLALSRGGGILGYTISGLAIADDLCGQISDIHSPDIMGATMQMLSTDLTTRLTKDAAGKGAALVVVAQRLGATDPTGELIRRARQQERDGLVPLKFDVVASPFINPSLERQGEIAGDYPDSWRVFQPNYGEEGKPVSHRFDQSWVDRLQAELPPQHFAAMYLLDCRQDAAWCQWKSSYIREIDEEDVRPQAVMMAIDMGLTEGGDRSALTVVGVQDGHVVILGLHFLEGHIEQMFGQITEYASQYNCHTVGVENAAGGDLIYRGLNGNIGGKHFNLVKLSHGGKAKNIRQSAMLGWAANGKLLARKGLPEMQTLQDQMRVIAIQKGKGHKADDLADSMVHACNYVWERWVKSGFTASSVNWQSGSGESGATPVVWGRGSHALVRPRVGIDGVERYQIPGFG